MSVSSCSSAAQREGTELRARLWRRACRGRMEKEGFSRLALAKREFRTCATCDGRIDLGTIQECIQGKDG